MVSYCVSWLILINLGGCLGILFVVVCFFYVCILYNDLFFVLREDVEYYYFCNNFKSICIEI